MRGSERDNRRRRVRRKKRDRHGGTDVRGKEEGKRDGGEGEGRILA